jgi:hypothetical protein
VRARAVNIRADVLADVSAAELNIVIDRLGSEDAANRFDLMVATNVLVYYDSFEQALAAANLTSMLRDGGLLLTNQPVPLPSVCGLSPVLIMSVAFDRVQSEAGSHERGDSIFVYRKPRAAASTRRDDSNRSRTGDRGPRIASSQER